MDAHYKKSFVTGFWVLLSVIVFGCFLLKAVGKAKSYDRTVEVKGLCEREVPADLANYPLIYSETGDDLQALYKEINRKNKIITDYLAKFGFEESDYNIPAPTITDNSVDSYNTSYRYRYRMKSVINIYTNKVDKVVELSRSLSPLIERDIAISSGDWGNSISYEFTSLNDIKPEMIDEAIANARDAAQQYAKNSKSRLGKIKNATQGYFSIDDRDSQTPYIKRVRVVTYVDYYLK